MRTLSLLCLLAFAQLVSGGRLFHVHSLDAHGETQAHSHHCLSQDHHHSHGHHHDSDSDESSDGYSDQTPYCDHLSCINPVSSLLCGVDAGSEEAASVQPAFLPFQYTASDVFTSVSLDSEPIPPPKVCGVATRGLLYLSTLRLRL